MRVKFDKTLLYMHFGRLVVTKEPQHAYHCVRGDQLTNSQKQRLKVSGAHVGVRTSPPTYRAINHSPFYNMRNISY